MNHCLTDKEIAYLVRDNLDKERVKKLLQHLKFCEKCRKKVEHYKNEMNKYEDHINNRRDS